MTKNNKTMKGMQVISGPGVHTRCRGFSLIEALVALLVLAIGLLAVAGMQLKALQGAHMAYQRSLASVIAIDAQERLWSKLKHVDGNLVCPGANEVLTEWKKAWFDDDVDRATLPGGGDSKIKPIKDTPCSYKVIVDWEEERFNKNEGSEDEDLSSFQYQFRLPGIES